LGGKHFWVGCYINLHSKRMNEMKFIQNAKQQKQC